MATRKLVVQGPVIWKRNISSCLRRSLWLHNTSSAKTTKPLGHICFERLTVICPSLQISRCLSRGTMDFTSDNAPDPDVLFTTDDEKTFQYQDELPSLPIPDLSKTLDRYLDSVKPHLGEAEFKHTEKIVRDFESGIGKTLHEKLQQRAGSMRNWLEKWWEDVAYLEGRYPSAPLVNMAGPGPYLDHYHKPQVGTQIERAALLVNFSMRYWKIIRMERLKPQRDLQGNLLCMNQFMNAFNVCRVPGIHKDELIKYFKTVSQGPVQSHLVVFCNGRAFFMEAFDENEEPLTQPELMMQFQRIKDYCANKPEGIGLGALTGHDRTSWAQTRSRLLALHPDNFHNLELIQTSIFTLALDDYQPVDESDLINNILGGNPKNRWFDKGQCMVFYKNGLSGTNCDHTPVDGMLFVASTYYNYLQLLHNKGKWQGSNTVRDLPHPRELQFHVDDVVIQEIEKATQIFTASASNLDCLTRHIMVYGRKYLRSKKVHPDTHVQLALQYAYYKIHGKPAATYETATTRKYYHARTETLRSCTTEAVEFAKAMIDTTVSLARKKDLYMIASEKHNALMTEATNLQGCDRHLLGLYQLAKEEGIPIPELYTDSAFTLSGGGGNFKLSTSYVGATVVYGGVAAMTEDGYGVFYKVQSDQIVPIITTWRTCKETSATYFCDTLEKCLKDMREVLDVETKSNL